MDPSRRPMVAFSLAALLLGGALASAFAGTSWKRGETLYRQNCAGCHGANLSGRCMAPNLTRVTRRMEDAEIVAHARMIGETMCCARHIRHITDAEFADIVAYFHAFDTDGGVRRRADQAKGEMGCCGMMGGMRGMDGMADDGAAPRPMPLTQKAGGLSVVFDSIPQPPHVGENGLQIGVRDERGNPVSDARVTVALSMPGMNMEGSNVTAVPKEDGVYAAMAPLDMAGTWRAKVTVARQGQRSVTSAFDFQVQNVTTAGASRQNGERPARPQTRRRMGCCSR